VSKGDELTAKQALDYNEKELEKAANQKKDQMEEAEKCGETWSEVKSLAGSSVHGEASERPIAGRPLMERKETLVLLHY
jgi:hypothetical protein